MDAQRAEEHSYAAASAPQGMPDAERLRALAESTGVGAIMSRNLVCLSPEAELHAVTEMFLDRDFSSAPVVDGRWLPLGVVSKTDLLRHFSGGARPPASLRQVGQLRGTALRKLAPDHPMPAAVQGVVRPLEAAPQAATPPSRGEVQVADVTAPYVLSLHEEASISVAAALMAYEGVHRLPIVDTGGRVVGVVSTLDIVRWLAEATGAGAGGQGG